MLGVRKGRVGRERGGQGLVARGQLKYRCLTVGVIPFSHDLHLEQSPKACHSTLTQEIKADSNLMRKVNLPNFYDTLLLNESCNFSHNMKARSANHPLTEGTGAFGARQPISLSCCQLEKCLAGKLPFVNTLTWQRLLQIIPVK